MLRLPTIVAAVALACLPMAAHAHKMFLLPSSTVLSDADDAWVTFDAAVSNDLFYFNHHALALDHLAITGPDGAKVEPENRHTGKWRSVFDLHLVKPGTYRVSIANDGLFATYVDAKGEKQRWRGNAQSLGEIPAGAKELKVSQAQGSINAFVTLGKPNDTALKPSNVGLELVPLTAPNDLVAGEPAKFRFLIDGKPAQDLKVSVIPGSTRYRDRLGEIALSTDAKGEFALTWPNAGMYWLSATAEKQKPTIANAIERRLSYVATLEVMPQ